MTTAPNPYAEYQANYRAGRRAYERERVAAWRRQERAAEKAKWAAQGLDAIFNDREVFFVGYISGMEPEQIDDCLDFTGRKMAGDQVRVLVLDGSAPDGLVIQAKSGLHYVDGQRLWPLPEGAKWVKKTC